MSITFATPSSHALMTCPTPSLNWKGLPRSLDESNFFPFVKVPANIGTSQQCRSIDIQDLYFYLRNRFRSWKLKWNKFFTQRRKFKKKCLEQCISLLIRQNQWKFTIAAFTLPSKIQSFFPHSGVYSVITYRFSIASLATTSKHDEKSRSKFAV